MGAKALWVASHPKSGNTWLRAFLLYLFANAREPVPLDELAGMSTFDSAVGHFNEAAGGARKTWTHKETAAWRGAAQQSLLKHAQGTCFVKTHSAFMSWHGHAMFDLASTVGAIYVVRNPLDVVASLASAIAKPPGAVIAIMNQSGFVWPGTKPQVPQLFGNWSQNVASWTARPNPVLHVMRYEDMVGEPEKTFAALTDFLKLDAPPERLQRAMRLASFDSLKSAERTWGFSERTVVQKRFFRAGRTGGWRKELTRDQAQRIVDTHRVQMTRFGYVPEGM
jgi:hypothetical protein